jgi:hypothetical protein
MPWAHATLGWSRGLLLRTWYGSKIQGVSSVDLLGDCLVKVKSKAVPLHAMEALGRRGGIAPTHSRPRY